MKAQTKALVASVVVIALALSAVSGITYSWWSDSENSTITITTGELSVDTSDFLIKQETLSITNQTSGQYTTSDGKVPEALSMSYGVDTNADVYLDDEKVNPDAPGLTISYKVTFKATVSVKYLLDVSIPDGITATTSITATEEGDSDSILGVYQTDTTKSLEEAYTVKIVVTALDQDIDGKFVFTNYITQSANPNAMVVSADVTGNTGNKSATCTDGNENTVAQVTSLPDDASKLNVTITTKDTAKKASIGLTLTDSDGKRITKFVGNGVEVTAILDGIYDGLYYNGTEEQPADATFTYSTDRAGWNADVDSAKYTKVVFKTTHFSEFIAYRTVGVSTAAELQTAINAGVESVKLVGDFTTDQDIMIESNFALDLNGHTIAFTGSAGFVYSAGFSVIGTQNGSKVTAESGAVFYSNTTGSSLTIDQGTYEAENTVVRSTGPRTDAGGGGFKVGNGGSVEIRGGDFKATSLKNAFLVNVTNGTLDIKGGTYYTEYQACIYATGSKVTISGGDFSVSEYVVCMPSNDELTISGGTFIGKAENYDVTLLNIGSDSKATITGGEFKVILGASGTSSRDAKFFFIGSDASASVTGGTFELVKEEGSAVTFNLLNCSSGSNCKIFAGGTFINVDPTKCQTSRGPSTTTCVADGYTANESPSGTWTVSKSQS